MPLALGSLWALIPAMLAVPAPGRANDLGGPNPAGRVAGLRGVRPASPIPADSWGVVIEPIVIPDMTTTLPHFSIPAQDETMAPLGSHERSVDVKDRAMDETKNLSETEGSQACLDEGSSEFLRTAIPRRSGVTRSSDVLGQGGFGRVYLAHDDDLDRPVAIKVPNPERISHPEDVEAYLNEARILARLDHPNIVPVFDVGRTEMDSASWSPSSSKAAIWRSGSGRLARPSGSRRNWSPRSPKHCITPTPEGWSTGTSSPPTS